MPLFGALGIGNQYLMTNTLDTRNRLNAELSKESDRGCAILSLCLLEESLAVLISALLPGGAADAKHFLPRGRLSTGIANAHKLGLIDNSTVATFKLLVEIRNIFAHGILTNVSFDTDSVRMKVSQLALPNTDSVPDVLAEVNANPRRRYMMAVDNVFFTLNEVKSSVRRLPRQQVPVLAVTRLSSSTDA